MDILYTVTETDAAVFAERDKAESVARIHAACEEALTWGEFRARLEPAEFAEVLDYMDMEAGEVDAAATFNADHLPGYEDGDYPEWLQSTMLEWFPKDLIAQFGSHEDSVFNGDFLELPAARADEIAEELRHRGHTVTRSELSFR